MSVLHRPTCPSVSQLQVDRRGGRPPPSRPGRRAGERGRQPQATTLPSLPPTPRLRALSDLGAVPRVDPRRGEGARGAGGRPRATHLELLHRGGAQRHHAVLVVHLPAPGGRAPRAGSLASVRLAIPGRSGLRGRGRGPGAGVAGTRRLQDPGTEGPGRPGPGGRGPGAPQAWPAPGGRGFRAPPGPRGPGAGGGAGRHARRRRRRGGWGTSCARGWRCCSPSCPRAPRRARPPPSSPPFLCPPPWLPLSSFYDGKDKALLWWEVLLAVRGALGPAGAVELLPVGSTSRRNLLLLDRASWRRPLA